MVVVRQSTIIAAPIETVWRVLRDFNGHDRWHPAVSTSTIEDGMPADAIGAVRRFRLAAGGVLREQLLSLSDAEYQLSYCLLEAPVPLMGYVAGIRLKPVTDSNATFWEWWSEFAPPPGWHDELVRLVRDDIQRAGFAAIRAYLSRVAGGVVPAKARPASSGSVSAAPAEGAMLERQPRRQDSLSGREVRTKAIVVERYGGPEVLRLRDITLPAPARGEVRVRHTAIGINFIDIYCRTGYFTLLTPPGVPGMEAAGVIEAVGEGVANLRPGDRVAYACPPVGAYSERRNMAADLLIRLPDDIPDDLAAAVMLKGITASFLLHDVHALRRGERVLIHAAAGGVGQFLVQWARHLGATVFATVSSAEKAQLAARLGADHVILYTREDFAEAISRLTAGQGVDVVYDAVGADTFASSITALAPRGHLVSFGQASGPIGPQDIGVLASKSVTLSRPNYGHYTDTPERLAPHVTRLFTALREGILTPAAPRRYPLADAETAHRDLESRRTTGALILIP
jgi:NADPH2:quinone reductase